MKILMVILQVLGGISLVPWFTVAGLSFMVFEAPGSTKKLTPWLYVVGIFSYPFVVGISYWRAWSYFELGLSKGSILWSCIPIIVFIIAFLFITQSSDFLNKTTNRKV